MPLADGAVVIVNTDPEFGAKNVADIFDKDDSDFEARHGGGQSHSVDRGPCSLLSTSLVFPHIPECSSIISMRSRVCDRLSGHPSLSLGDASVFGVPLLASATTSSGLDQPVVAVVAPDLESLDRTPQVLMGRSWERIILGSSIYTIIQTSVNTCSASLIGISSRDTPPSSDVDASDSLGPNLIDLKRIWHEYS